MRTTEIGWIPVEDHPGRCCSSGAARWWRNCNHQSLLHTEGVIEGGHSHAVVVDPERTLGRKRHAPRVDELRIGIRRQSGNIGDEVVLHKAVAGRWRCLQQGWVCGYHECHQE